MSPCPTFEAATAPEDAAVETKVSGFDVPAGEGGATRRVGPFSRVLGAPAAACRTAHRPRNTNVNVDRNSGYSELETLRLGYKYMVLLSAAARVVFMCGRARPRE